MHHAGFYLSARNTLDSFALKLLRIFFGFHPWHADSPLSRRPYRRVVAELVNTLRPDCVVEVGCGLGSVLSLVNAKHRVGYDIDAGAIKAARCLRGSSISFRKGDMSAITETSIDVLILVNWIHDISPSILEEWLTPLLPFTAYLCLDAIDSDNPAGYRYEHNFSFLGKKVQLLKEVRAENEGRRFIIYEVLP